MIILSSLFVFLSSFVFAAEGKDSFVYDENVIEDDYELTSEEIAEVVNVNKSTIIRARAALVYDTKYDKILYAKNIDDRLPNASTTKILTAIVAYENANMNDLVTVSEKAARIGGSTINLRKGNKVLLGDLMKGLLICSGNDAAIAIAEYVGGSVENFCNMMNQKALELGATNTHFVTPHGLDNDDHYTTARDLSIFASYLLKIPYLAEIVDTQYTTIKIDDNTRELRTTNEMLGIYPNAKGVKTGYTGKAGRCLVTAIESGDRELITVVLGCDTKKQRTSESIWLIHYGYTEFEKVDIYQNMKRDFIISVEKATSSNYHVNVVTEKYDVLPVGSADKIEYAYQLEKDLVAPLEKGEKIGEISVILEGKVLDTLELRLPNEVRRKSVLEYMAEIFRSQIDYITIMN